MDKESVMRWYHGATGFDTVIAGVLVEIGLLTIFADKRSRRGDSIGQCSDRGALIRFPASN